MITEDEFLRISVFLKRKCGIDMANKKTVVDGRLANYIKNKGWKNYNEYMDVLERDSSGVLGRELLHLLTTNYTYFMREFEHLEFFKREVLPWLKQKESRTKDLRVWCGAASSGEEPYTIAMVIKEFFGIEGSAWDTKVLATDISMQVLQEAFRGIYSEDKLSSLPPQWKKRFFQKVTGQAMYQVKEELKREVIFRQFNLMNPFPFKKRMHTVFLRNVMIYFDERTKTELLQKVYNQLEPGGYLFIGMTESLNKDAVPFQVIQPSIFRKPGGE